MKKYQADSISLMFPSAYMGSPSSIFGHTFLRLNQKNKPVTLAYSLNYAALLPENTGFFEYLSKGLNGGFVGKYSIEPYHIKLREYKNIENREIWSFDLKLSEQQLAFLSFAIWELKYAKFNYYFATKNCAYQILALLKIAESKLPVQSTFSNYTLPSDTINLLKKHGLISQAYYQQSAFDYLYTQTKEFSLQEKQHLISLSQGNAPTDSFLLLSTRTKIQIINASINYLDILIQSSKIDRIRGEKNLLSLLQLKDSLDKDSMPIHQSLKSTYIKPHNSHRLSLSKKGDRHIMGLSFGTHQLTDPVGVYKKGTEISLIDSEIAFKQGKISLEKLTLFSLKSLNPTTQFDRTISWEIKLEQKKIAQHVGDFRLTKLHIGAGKTVEYLNTLFYTMGTLSLDYSNELDTNLSLSAGIKLGLLKNHSLGASRLEFYYDNHIFNNDFNDNTLKLYNNFDIDNNNSIFINLSSSKIKEYKDDNIEVGYIYRY